MALCTCWNVADESVRESGEDLPEEAVEPPRPEKGYRENDDRGDHILHERVDQRHRRRRAGSRRVPPREQRWALTAVPALQESLGGVRRRPPPARTQQHRVGYRVLLLELLLERRLGSTQPVVPPPREHRAAALRRRALRLGLGLGLGLGSGLGLGLGFGLGLGLRLGLGLGLDYSARRPRCHWRVPPRPARRRWRSAPWLGLGLG